MERLPLQECVLLFPNINMSRKRHVWVQGYQTLEKQQRHGGEGDTGSSKWGSGGVSLSEL